VEMVQTPISAKAVQIALRWRDWHPCSGTAVKVTTDVSLDDGRTWEFGGRGGVFPIWFQVTGNKNPGRSQAPLVPLPEPCLMRITIAAHEKVSANLEVEFS
jgi:hypothetical protein